ncbi:MAG: fluoride efflux transporter FluC [Nocardioides sp.]
MRRELLAVAVGGAAGALARWSLSGLAPEDQGFPWATLAINVAGCFALALLPALPAVRDRALLLVALGPGLLGGFTTLSAYAEEARALIADGHAGLAAAYVVGTLGACLLAVSLAVSLAAAFTSGPGARRSR